MFEPAPAPRRRPMFAVSATAHAALAAVLVVPPLFATPEPPELDGIVKIDWVPVLTIDAPARISVDSLRRVREGGLGARTASASGAAARPPVSQPTGIGSVLPDPTSEPEGQFTFEGTDEQSESGIGVPGETGKPGSGGPGGGILDATAPGVSPPVAIETIAPPYPELARRARIEGVVVLDAVIGADGAVREVRVAQGVSPLLDPAAVEAVRRWRYRPASVGARPVAVLLKVVLTFSLRNL
ncbi:MAG: energy transducer TonB [Acidobacteria bacterium]|nr:energy transducer TonB [Acidobacteriota bacterium]